jgi:hypothetical protein
MPQSIFNNKLIISLVHPAFLAILSAHYFATNQVSGQVFLSKG